MANITQTTEKNPVFLAYLDILGFSKYILNNSHDSAVGTFDLIHRGVELALAIPVQTDRKEATIIRNEPNKHGQIVIKNVKIRSIVISDTIVFWTEDSSIQAFYDLLETVKQFMRNTFINGFPVRGAISHGEMTCKGGRNNENPTLLQYKFIGKAFVRAAELEKKQLWAGCVVDPNLFKDNPKLEEWLYFFEQRGFLTSYIVPKKDGDEKMSVIKWIEEDDDIDINLIPDSFFQHKKVMDEGDRVKIKNTIQFISDMLRNNSSPTESSLGSNSESGFKKPVRSKLTIKTGTVPHIWYKDIISETISAEKSIEA